MDWGSPTVSLPFIDKTPSNVYKTVISKLCGLGCLKNGGFIDKMYSDVYLTRVLETAG